MMQTGQAELLRRVVLGPLEAEAQARKTTRAAKAAATKVDFFTMVRGEN
jgi:alpha-D-ribose 1-methylphosphonate 5-triphosphate synthase subunit PhnG